MKAEALERYPYQKFFKDFVFAYQHNKILIIHAVIIPKVLRVDVGIDCLIVAEQLPE
ncbi:hypothetical protein KIN20_036965 [Parelaphostrongylus tenuis]|uniref:Uncharacterized protein n=1 Tax=Parelaphostrongylus tenuis TaxID=148309 RepID=A0AAD5WM29_PARTN|nr:hypothetical protein KIN20_036965 [Parelaphostrongylus tenuis]